MNFNYQKVTPDKDSGVKACQQMLKSYYLICKCIIGLSANCIQMPQNALAPQLWQTFEEFNSKL